jgi:predicted DCC family thiol-disulfide oxidoreductase YuxK
MTRVHVVYDGLCLFCIRSLNVVRVLDRRDVVAYHDASDRDAVTERFPSLVDAELDAAMYAIDTRGRAYAGFFAFRRVARELPAAWPLLPLLHLPGAGFVGSRVYALIARNRSRLGCRIEEAARDA